MAVRVNYPRGRGGEPARLAAHEVRAIAVDLRRRLFGAAIRLVEVDELVRKASRMVINGREVEISWDLDNPVVDPEGAQVLGVCEHDPDVPDTAIIALNAKLVRDFPELRRSTAGHELGHAVFDMPAAIASGRGRVFRLHAQGFGPTKARDWREWRADEFMGAFLMPPAMAGKVVAQLAGEIGVPLRWVRLTGTDQAVPALASHSFDAVESIVLGAAERFGVSPAFAAVRLKRYGMIGRK
jgi:hypothetical protein